MKTCSLSRLCAALGAALSSVVVETATASFLEDLATNANRVVSAPYATGGDVILQIGSYEFAHVFTNPAAASTFTVTENMSARILVVGGGGAGGTGGGSGGGGGGGGVVHALNVSFETGTYAVTVGAGGTMVSQATADKVPGGNSSIALASSPSGFAFETITAYGGGCGVGWKDNSATGSSGGSGGGGAKSTNGSAATAVSGQGNIGGNPNSSRAGGGGGAGENGANGSSSGAGVGGEGLAFDITGQRVVYGSGGGGGAVQDADVMASGGENGGNGSCKASSATAGANGTGGGGGGGSSYAGRSGNGGSGIVVIRYMDLSLVGDEPILAVHEDQMTIGCNSILLPLGVMSAGAGASTVTLNAAWRYEGDSLDLGSQIVSDFIGETSLSIPVNPGRTYSITVVADNGQTGGTTEWTKIVESAPMFSSALSYTAAGSSVNYTIDGTATADSQRLEFWVGPGSPSMTNQVVYTDASLMALGSHLINPFAIEQFGEAVSVMLRHIAVVGGHAFTNDTAVLSMTITDGATYTWKSAVSDGLWCDGANWTASVAGGLGWPSAGAKATFPSCSATVRVDRVVETSSIQFSAANGNYRFLGTLPNAAAQVSASVSDFPNGQYTFDNIRFMSQPTSSYRTAAKKFYLVNGATHTIANNGKEQEFGSGGCVEVGNGTTCSIPRFVGEAGAAIFVDGGTLAAVEFLDLAYKSGQSAMSLVLKDASARLTTKSLYANYTAATISVRLDPDGGYSSSAALITGTSTGSVLPSKGQTLTFEIPKSADAKRCPKCNVMVADWSKGSINTSLVAFGEHEEKADCYFFYTTDADPSGTRYRSAAEVAAAGATVKYLWYRHVSSLGTIISVR